MKLTVGETENPALLVSALRTFGIGAASILILMGPAFVAGLGRQRTQPLPLLKHIAKDPRADGTILLPPNETPNHRRLVVTSLRIDDGLPLKPASLPVVRGLFSLPTGSRLSYGLLDETLPPSSLNGVVTETDMPPRAISAAVIRAVVSLLLAVAGLLLCVAGTARRAMLSGAALSGLGLIVGTVMLEPNLVLIHGDVARNLAIICWQAFPRDLAFFLVIGFLTSFPGEVKENSLLRVARRFLLVGALASVVILVVAQVPDFLERWFSIGAQIAIVRAQRFLRLGLIAVASMSAVYLLGLQVRLYRRLALRRSDRARAALVCWAVPVGVGVASVVVLLQTLLSFAGGQPVGTLGMAVVLGTLVSIPVAVVYSILTPSVPPFRILLRRATAFSFSEKTVRIVLLTPLAALLVFLYANRHTPLHELLGSHPLFLAAAVLAAVLGLLYRDRARRGLERLFFRDREDSRRVMGELAEKSRGASDPESLEKLLAGEIGKALHAESAALFVRERASGTFVCPGRGLQPLDANATIVGLAGKQGSLELGPDDRHSPLASLPEIERHWITETHARLLLPLKAADGTVIGLLTVGDKLSELPFDEEDRRLLSAVAASGALALENSLLRSSAGGGPVGAKLAVASDDVDLARSCPTCSQLFSYSAGVICPHDQTPLDIADLPHVLAGKYRFERRLGSGGMGVVYLARDLSLGRFVAVKTLPKVSPEAAIRLRREARATARVLHPNLAVIFAAETWRGTPMLLLEYLEGGTLAQRIGSDPIPIATIIEWGIALSGALEAAHRSGVLHRDIKPSNVGFTASGDPKLLDFGLASLLEEPELLAAVEASTQTDDQLETQDAKQLTGSGRIVGTVPYLAPEAILGETPQVSFDLWSLSLTLYEATTGRNPFLEMPVERTFNRILSQPAPDARAFRPDCPEELSSLLAAALARKPNARPGTARELRIKLQKLAPSLAA